MDGRTTFLGNFLQAVDAKGRVAIPSSLRSIMERNSTEKVLVITPHAGKPCLVGADRGRADEYYREIKERQAADRAAGRETIDDEDAFDDYELSEELSFDSSGRFILSSFYRDQAQLGDWAFFRAKGNTFQIWSPENALADPELKPKVREKLLHDLAARGVVLS